MLKESDKARLCELLRIAQKPLTAQVVAAELGKKYQTWMQELSAFDESHQLKFFDAVNALMLTGRPFEFLDCLARRLGYYIIPVKPAPKVDLSRLMNQVTKEIGDVAAVFLAATAPKSSGGQTITESEKTHLKKEISEAREVLNQLEINLNGSRT